MVKLVLVFMLSKLGLVSGFWVRVCINVLVRLSVLFVSKLVRVCGSCVLSMMV